MLKDLADSHRRVTVAERADAAEGMLRTIGLTKAFAPVVVLVGHGSTTENNAYATAYDCGACGGNPGLVNAAAMAQVLNDPAVRRELADRGIEIPPTTRALAALHDTTTDEVTIHQAATEERAAQQAEKDGISASVFDLRTIIPYDWDGIAELVKKTNRVIIAHEDQLTCGFGAEIAARISDELFGHLDAPIKRVAAMDCPVAYYPGLEEVILPQSGDVLQAIREVARY